MRVLVTGGSSYLGRRLLQMMPESYEVHYTFFKNSGIEGANGRFLDMREPSAVCQYIHSLNPDVILHLAGSNRGDEMASVIRKGADGVVAGAQATNARLIHLSTDSIFDGLNPPYGEAALPSPVNEYGRAKADAEKIIQTYPNHVIVRTSLVYGLDEIDHGTRWMIESLSSNKPITLFANQVRNPVWRDTLAAACVELISAYFMGVMNIAGNQPLTRAAFAIRMLTYWQRGNRNLITIQNSQKDRWPLDCQLQLQLVSKRLNTPMLGVDEVISHHRSAFS